MVVDEFLNQQKNNFQVVPPPAEFKFCTTEKNYIRIFPHIHDMEGSFAVKLQKIS
jgi:16S rRNA C967 or C1407 C5-methylase (RsmB/RsmF family)